MVPIPPDIITTYKKNLSALAEVDSPLAERLADISWPEDLKFIPALDGTPTAFSREFGRSGWYAFSSVPAIREKVVCEQFSPGTSNVILPGAGQGIGLQGLLERFNLCQSIYVWEPNLIHVAALLALYDLSREIAGRRLILLTEADLTKNLVDFVGSHLEIAHPEKMMSWPWITENCMQEISLKVEQAVGELIAIINRNAQTLQEQVHKILTDKSGHKINNIKIISPHPHPRIHQLARDFHEAAEKLGYHSQVYVFDRAEHSSGIGILRELINTPPDLIISVGIEKKRWSVKIPPHIPFISVLSLPGASLGEQVSEISDIEKNEYFVLGSREDFAVLQKKVQPENLFLMEIAVNQEKFRSLNKEIDFQVAVIADHPVFDPEKIGINQESHKFLWKKIEELIRQKPLDYSNAQADVFIRRATDMTGIKLMDPELIKSFSFCVKRYLGPGVQVEVMVEKLVREGLEIRIYGSGWEETRFVGKVLPLPENSEILNEVFNSAGMVMFLDNDSNFRPNVFNALCAGRKVILKKNSEELLDQFPEIVHEVVFLDPAVDLATQVRGFLENVGGPNEANRKVIAEKYNITGFLRTLLEKVAQ
jgi:hypothetical protein